MKKSFIGILLASLLCFSLVGCGGNTDGTENGGKPSDDGTGYKVTFVCDENVKVYAYDTQDMSGEGRLTTTAYSRDSETGEKLNDGNGQVNFKLVFSGGYELGKIDITPGEEVGYKNLKGSADTKVENGYRITKITDDLTVTVTSKEEGEEEDYTLGYKVTFECDENVKVYVYKTQDMSEDGAGGDTSNVAYSRTGGTGELTKDGGQVNFIVVAEDGYEVSVVITPGKGEGYKNIKKGLADTDYENGYRITQITADLTVVVTATPTAAE